MTGGNRLGPNDRGSMSGRGAGYCAGNDRPGYANLDSTPTERLRGGGRGREFGRGRGRGAGRGGENRGAGFGFRNRWWPLRDSGASQEGESERLQIRAAELQTELDGINNRINNLTGTTSEDETGENK